MLHSPSHLSAITTHDITAAQPKMKAQANDNQVLQLYIQLNQLMRTKSFHPTSEFQADKCGDMHFQIHNCGGNSDLHNRPLELRGRYSDLPQSHQEILFVIRFEAKGAGGEETRERKRPSRRK